MSGYRVPPEEFEFQKHFVESSFDVTKRNANIFGLCVDCFGDLTEVAGRMVCTACARERAKGMRKRSEVSVETKPAAAEPPEATTFRTKCAVCKLPQHLEPGTTSITCAKGHRGAYGIDEDGSKVQWVNGKFVEVTSGKSEEPKPAPKPESLNPTFEVELPKKPNIPTPTLADALLARDPPIQPEHAVSVERPEVVSVTYGAQKISAVQYNTFELGPFFASTTVRAGETREDAAARLYEELSAFAEKTYEREFPRYMARVKEAIAAAKK